MSSYMDRIEVCILTALRNSPCTLEEIIRKCAGAYPTLVIQTLEELHIHNSLVPLYTTQEDAVPYALDVVIDYPKTELVTYQIENNPVLSNWYFSWHTCQKIGQLDVWHDKKILFLGTPRLFEFFVLQNKARFVSLIDYDNVVIEQLISKYGKRRNVSIECNDINFLEKTSEKYDYVFFDPPWYIDSYISWLGTAAKLVMADGKLVFPLFPYMVRPTASQERNKLFQISRKISKNVFTIPEYLEYDIPSFERNELHHVGIDLRANWKVSDMMVLQGVNDVLEDLRNIQVDTEYLSWKEFNWFGIRWFVKTKTNADNGEGCEVLPLITLPNDSLYLKSPSRRDPKLKLINVLSSKGHGLCVSNTSYFINVMEQVVSFDYAESIDPVWKLFTIDEKSKRIIEDLRGECDD